MRSQQYQHTPLDLDSFSKDVTLPKEGITLRAMKAFIEQNGGVERFQGLTTTQVCNDILKVITLERQCSYCDLLLQLVEEEKQKNEKEGKEVDEKQLDVGKANVFICHVGAFIFLDVVSTLETHFKETPDIIIFFDLFSNNQHFAGDLPFEWTTTTFKSALQEFGHTGDHWYMAPRG